MTPRLFQALHQRHTLNRFLYVSARVSVAQMLLREKRTRLNKKQRGGKIVNNDFQIRRENVTTYLGRGSRTKPPELRSNVQCHNTITSGPSVGECDDRRSTWTRRRVTVSARIVTLPRLVRSIYRICRQLQKMSIKRSKRNKSQ